MLHFVFLIINKQFAMINGNAEEIQILANSFPCTLSALHFVFQDLREHMIPAARLEF